MKIKKYGLLITLSIMIFIVILALGSGVCFADDSSNYSYTELSDGTIKITDYTGTATNLTIPSTIDGKTVSEIGSYAFYYGSITGSLTIPSTVTTIGSYAFYYCDGLTSITIGSGVSSISSTAFLLTYGNTKFEVNSSNQYYTSVDGVVFSKDKTIIYFYPEGKSDTSYAIPSTVTTIAESCFYEANFKSVTMPDTVTTIEYAAFAQCDQLTTDITLSANLQTIGEYAFNYASIGSITIPATVTEIGATAFVKATSLTAINVSTSNKYYTSVDGVLFNKAKTTLILYPAGKTGTSYTIPSTVTLVEANAFIDSLVTSVTIPSSVKELGEWCFARSAITSITIPSSVETLNFGICAGCTSLTTAVVNSSANLPYEMFYECTNLSSVTLNNNIEEIGSRAFMSCTSLTKITLPTNLKRITYGFMNCTNLSSVVIPSGVVFISQNSFPSTTSVDISNTKLILLETGDYAVAYDIYVTGTLNYDYAYEVLELVNEIRAENGVSALTMDKSLLESAMERAAETSLYFSHTRPNGTSCGTIDSKIYGENIAAAYSTPEDVVEGWMNSSGHKANILSSDYTTIGIGYINVNGTSYWVQCFGIGTADVPSSKPTGTEEKTYKIQTIEDSIDFKFADTSSVSLVLAQQAAKELRNYNTWTYSKIDGNSATWSSSNTSVATVDSNGKVKALSVGTTTITAQIGSQTASYTVNVTLPTDTKEGAWYVNAMTYMYSKGYMTGTTETTFEPNSQLTRGMLVSILYKIEGGPSVSSGATKFSDVTNSKMYYYSAVKWASENGIVNGYENGTFGPNDPVTREQLAVMLRNYCEYKKKYVAPSTDLSGFSDGTSVSTFAQTAMKWATENKVITGSDDGLLNPKGTATRAEVAGMIYKYFSYIK